MDRLEIIRGLTEIRDPDFMFARNYLADARIDLITAPVDALAWLERQATAGVHEAQFTLAKLLTTGVLGKIDQTSAFEWCTRATAGGFEPAFVLLSAFYSEGWAGVQRDDARALSLLHQGAEAGYAHAMALLATAYSEGIRVAKDTDKGHFFLRQAAECGDATSQLHLGRELLEAKDAQQQMEAIRWIRTAAKQNFSSAHRELADLYWKGVVGLPRDETKARFHRQKADELEQDG